MVFFAITKQNLINSSEGLSVSYGERVVIISFPNPNNSLFVVFHMIINNEKKNGHIFFRNVY